MLMLLIALVQVATAAPARTMAMTIDALPTVSVMGQDIVRAEKTTRDLLAAIAKAGVPAIGFVNEGKLQPGGKMDPRRVALLQQWLDAGLELGNHTFSHPDLHGMPLKEFQDDVVRGEVATRGLLAAKGRCRATSGIRSCTPAGRSRSGTAWSPSCYEQQSVLILGREPAQTLLLHANALNAATLEALVERIRKRGYTFVPLGEALKDPAYASKDEYVGAGGITWLHRWALSRRGPDPIRPHRLNPRFYNPLKLLMGNGLSGRGPVPILGTASKPCSWCHHT